MEIDLSDRCLGMARSAPFAVIRLPALKTVLLSAEIGTDGPENDISVTAPRQSWLNGRHGHRLERVLMSDIAAILPFVVVFLAGVLAGIGGVFA